MSLPGVAGVWCWGVWMNSPASDVVSNGDALFSAVVLGWRVSNPIGSDSSKVKNCKEVFFYK